MRPLGFGLTPTDEQRREKEECIRSLKENGKVLQLMKVHDLDVSLIQRYPWRIRSWFEGLQPCLNCKGLDQCGQKVKGYYNNLEYDGILQVVQTACVHERKFMTEEAHMDRYLVSDLPASLHTVVFNRIDTSKEPNEYLRVLNTAMEACASGKGLYLCGTMGSGKTYLSACACNYHAQRGKSVAFIHYPSFCRRMANSAVSGEFRSELTRLQMAKFLVIDDIGAESVTEWNRDQILLPLLSSRYEDGLPTWFTSNEDLVSLEKHFRYTGRGKEEEVKAARIIERIEHLASVVEVTSKDRRKQL